MYAFLLTCFSDFFDCFHIDDQKRSKVNISKYENIDKRSHRYYIHYQLFLYESFISPCIFEQWITRHWQLTKFLKTLTLLFTFTLKVFLVLLKNAQKMPQELLISGIVWSLLLWVWHTRWVFKCYTSWNHVPNVFCVTLISIEFSTTGFHSVNIFV